MASKCSKTYENLKEIELVCILKLKFPLLDVRTVKTKPNIINKIKETTPNFDSCENLTVYYFDYEEDGTCKLIEPEFNVKTEYLLTNNNNKNAFCESIKTEDNILLSLQNQVGNLSSILTSRSTPSLRNKFGNLKIKIVYDEAKGVNQFLNSVERFSLANNISSDQDQILIAINGLSESDYGEMIIETLSDSEKEN